MTASPTHVDDDRVYLCQVGPKVSCGACCGLYNVADPAPQALETLLARRSRRFAEVPRTVDGIDAFQAEVMRTEDDARPFGHFHHCPFLGLIDQGRRVGCLLHPMASGNAGIDWRGLSYYGGMACRTYFCPSTRHLPGRWLTAIRQSMDHWYLHGLILTERRLLTCFFEELERRLHRPVRDDDFAVGSHAAAFFKRFAGLKVNWPFRRKDAPGVCNYFFEDGRYGRPTVSFTACGKSWTPLAGIFRELDAAFSSAAELRQAKRTVEELLAQIVVSLR